MCGVLTVFFQIIYMEALLDFSAVRARAASRCCRCWQGYPSWAEEVSEQPGLMQTTSDTQQHQDWLSSSLKRNVEVEFVGTFFAVRKYQHQCVKQRLFETIWYILCTTACSFNGQTLDHAIRISSVQVFVRYQFPIYRTNISISNLSPSRKIWKPNPITFKSIYTDVIVTHPRSKSQMLS